MVTAREYAKFHNCSKQWVIKLARAGRIEGAVLDGAVWVMPMDSPLPERQRPGPKPGHSATVRRVIQRAAAQQGRAIRAQMKEEQPDLSKLSPAQLHTLKRRQQGCKRTGEVWECNGSYVGPVWLEGMSKADFDARVDEFLTWEESDYALAAPAWIPPI